MKKKAWGLIIATIVLLTTTGLGQNCVVKETCPDPGGDPGRFNIWMLTSGGNRKNVQFDDSWGVAQTVYTRDGNKASMFYSRGNGALYIDQYMFFPVASDDSIYVFDYSAGGQYVGVLHDGDDASLQVVTRRSRRPLGGQRACGKGRRPRRRSHDRRAPASAGR